MEPARLPPLEIAFSAWEAASLPPCTPAPVPPARVPINNRPMKNMMLTISMISMGSRPSRNRRIGFMWGGKSASSASSSRARITWSMMILPNQPRNSPGIQIAVDMRNLVANSPFA